MGQEIDERLITKKLKQGDILSFDAIFNKYHKKVYYFALSYLKDKEDAEDVVQEVFMNLWRFRDQINENYTFSNYLFKIVYTTTCKKLRKRISDKRHCDEVLKNISIEDNSTKNDIEYNSLLETANQLIKRLSSREKEILLLNINDGLSSEEIASKLSISKKTVENYLSSSKRFLRKSLSVTG